MSRWPTCRAYSWSRWNKIRSRAGGSAPSHRSPGCPISARSWDSMMALVRAAWSCRAATRPARVSSGPTYQRSSRMSAPRAGDMAALETPLEPSQLDVGEMLDQLDGRPARRQPAGAQFALGQAVKLAHELGPEVVEVGDEDLGARRRGSGGFGKRDA